MKKTDLILDWNQQKQVRQLGFLLLILAALVSLLAARIAYLLNA